MKKKLKLKWVEDWDFSDDSMNVENALEFHESDYDERHIHFPSK